MRSAETANDGTRWIDIPGGFQIGDSVYLLQMKTASKRYPRILARDVSPYRRQPGDEKLPILDLTSVGKNELQFFPEGLYVQVSAVADVFAAQSAHPVRVIIELNGETSYDLVNHKTVLPLPKKQLIISLDPFCPPETENDLQKTLDVLIGDGFTTFIVNNIAHIARLKGKKGVNVIAGPYLYTFNRWAVSWLENQNIGAFVMPYENSRKNLLATFPPSVRARILVPVFAYPALFRLRFKLPPSYDFTYFTDKEGAAFKVNSTPDGSFVMPETAFSVTDKCDLLYGDGIKRILLDFSKTKVTKPDLRKVMNSIIKKIPLDGAYRFNWKEGFYSPKRIEEQKSRGQETRPRQKN